MNSLLIDLYKYRSREKRDAQEDWLTECLAAILRALSDQQFAAALRALTGQDCAQALADGLSRLVSTQVTVNFDDNCAHRPDMVVRIGAEPWLVFENKVAAPLDEREDQAAETIHQLHRYAQWLRSQAFDARDLRKALVFVTHHTPAPADFVRQDFDQAIYGDLDRYSATWGQMARILAEQTEDMDSAFHVRALVNAFEGYLEVHNMAHEYPEHKAIAVLGLHLEAVESIEKLVNDMLYRAERVAPASGNRAYAVQEASHGKFTGWRYLNLPATWPTETFVSVGVWFPEVGSGWYREEIAAETGKPVSSAPKLFLQLAHGDDNMFNGIMGKPGAGWHRPSTDFVTLRDFDSFHGEPSERANAIFVWIDEGVRDLKAFITAQS